MGIPYEVHQEYHVRSSLFSRYLTNAEVLAFGLYSLHRPIQSQLVLCGRASIDLASTIVLNSLFYEGWATSSLKIRAFIFFNYIGVWWIFSQLIRSLCVDSK